MRLERRLFISAKASEIKFIYILQRRYENVMNVFGTRIEYPVYNS